MRAFVICFLLLISALSFAATPFDYSGYRKAQYASWTTRTDYVKMTDDVHLAVDVFLPKDGPAQDKFPVVLTYLPYQRATVNLENGQISDASKNSEVKFFLSYGYAVVYADMRGTGASAGWYMDFMPRLNQDGKELVDWIASQPWCDGNVGMTGSSYLGWSQMAVAEQRPRALKCIAPECIPLDGYTGEAYPGGIFNQGFYNLFGQYMRMINTNHNLPAEGIRPTKPAVDEDGDGEWADEIPIDTNGDGSILDEQDPKYKDGQPRKNIYWQATREHMRDYDFSDWVKKIPFIDQRTPLGYTMYELGPGGFIPKIAKTDIPIYHFGGWFDGFTRGTFELYCTLAATNKSRVIVGPSYHDFLSGPFWTWLGISKGDAEQTYLMEHLRFYDRYLKGVKNGFDTEPPISIYVMNGAGWRHEKEWPLSRAKDSKYYLGPDNKLTDKPVAEGSDIYKADFTQDGRYGANKGNRYVGIVSNAPQEVPNRSSLDAKCLTYTTQPLSDDLEVTGHPIAQFWASSNTKDCDFFLYLEDIAPDGKAILVTETQLRAGFATLHDNNKMVLDGKESVDVLPKLPWHGFEQKDYVTDLSSHGPIELKVDFQPTSWVFKKGHCIRMSVACSDYPTFALNPQLSPQNKPNAPDNVLPEIKIYRDKANPSAISLPVVND